MSRTPHLYGAVGAFIFNDKNQLLLLCRQNTGYYDGWWIVPAWHIEKGETPIQAIIKECKEEVWIHINPTHSDCFAILHRSEEKAYIDYGFLITKWRGDITNREPDKCSEIRRFWLDELPDTLTPSTQKLITMYKNKQLYAEKI